MSYWEIMKMPIKTFYMMSEAVRRIQAETDLRTMAITAVAESPEGFTEHQRRLVLELGEVVTEKSDVMNAVRDQTGFDELKNMAAATM